MKNKPQGVAFLASAIIAAASSVSADSIARLWNEQNLAAVRLSFPDPPVHARNLFHVSAAIYDSWAAYDPVAVGYLHRESATAGDVAVARHEAISYAAYRVLSHRYNTVRHPNTSLINAQQAQNQFNIFLTVLGYDRNNTIVTGNSPAAVGNRVAETIITWTANDNSNETGGYTDPTYTPVNDPMILAFSGTTLNDPNRWQPLEFVEAFSQTGQPLSFTTQEFIGSHWRDVWPFALSREPGEFLYFDPGEPPQLEGDGDEEFKEGNAATIRYSSLLDPATAPIKDYSPGTTGNNTLGLNDGSGYPVNPSTSAGYAPNLINEADFGRVVAEYWADGPESETPPGHWNVIANEVVDHPSFERRFMGTGPVLEELEWDAKMYFLVNASVHDAAVAAWTCKREYDYVRPISAIRYMGARGQSSDPSVFPYSEEGLPLEPGLVEVVTAATASFGEKHSHLGFGAIGKIAVRSWRGEPEDIENDTGGVGWILAEDWVPYQRDTFVTPAFAAYLSGHSTFSRAAAEVLTRLTGSEFFPGGLAIHEVAAGELEFEAGPTATVELQWATYYDAADQAGISRLYGGIHVPADDGPGRIVGSKCGIGAWELGIRYFDGSILQERPRLTITPLAGAGFRLDWTQRRGLFYNVRRSDDLQSFADETSYARAFNDRGSYTVSSPDPGRTFYQVQQAE
ncbi:MAG: hypothetical protein CMO35_09665 [Verrucomicrobiaceae bacterium]|jgi:hypothetical protein|nr:hypothetical protein [Verrucomicrobiaceae bacterium]